MVPRGFNEDVIKKILIKQREAFKFSLKLFISINDEELHKIIDTVDEQFGILTRCDWGSKKNIANSTMLLKTKFKQLKNNWMN